MNIGIYIGGTPNKTLDCREILEKGNPGIGGTEYEFCMLSIWLHQHVGDDCTLTVFQAGKYLLKEDILSVNGLRPQDVITACEEIKIDILIVDSRWALDLIKQYNGTSVKLIVWCHCVGSMYRHLLFDRWRAVNRVVFVSRGHYLNFIDNPVARKSTYAFNAVSFDEKIDLLREKNPFKLRPYDVVFMGALDESKGFHVLAKSWPEVLKRVPDARLHVIGSANLYGGNCELGPLGIADKEYEKQFGSYLSTEDGRLHPSVILHGKLAEQKYEVMSKCRVGVPNPDGKTETFCICAVEMQLCGCKVVTQWSSGYIDTIPAPNVMVKKKKDLAACIAEALLEPDFDCSSNLKNIRDHFSMDAVGDKWLRILASVSKNTVLDDSIVVPMEFQSRKRNAQLRKWIPFLPPMGFVRDTCDRFVAVVKRKI